MGLLERLGIHYETEEGFLQHADDLLGQLYEKFYSYALKEEDLEEIRKESSRYLSSAYMLDAMLLLRYFPGEGGMASQPLDELQEYVPCMTERQYALYLYYLCWEGKEPFDKLLKLNANGFFLTQAGVWYWKKGEYTRAIELLSKGYSAASEEGGVKTMLEAKVVLGNCYSSLDSPGSREMMMKHYKVAERIAQAMGEEDWVQDIYYNIAASFLEWGQIGKAEEYFPKCARRDALYYHKYAICKERQGKREEALELLGQGRKEFSPKADPVFGEMYDVVEYRLRHGGYRKDPEYERILRACMKHLGERFPKSYQKFHVPFLIEILGQQRKYKEICELMQEFTG